MQASSPADILAATPPVSAQHQALLETVASMDAETVQEVVVAQVRPTTGRRLKPHGSSISFASLLPLQAMTGGSGSIAKAIATEEAASDEAPAPATTADKTAELQLRLDSIENQNEAIEEEREALVRISGSRDQLWLCVACSRAISSIKQEALKESEAAEKEAAAKALLAAAAKERLAALAEGKAAPGAATDDSEAQAAFKVSQRVSPRVASAPLAFVSASQEASRIAHDAAERAQLAKQKHLRAVKMRAPVVASHPSPTIAAGTASAPGSPALDAASAPEPAAASESPQSSGAAAAGDALDAIRQVAASATVAREKLLLARIKQVQASIEEAAEAARREAAGVPAADGAAPQAADQQQQVSYDRSLEFLKGRLNRMLNVIEKDVAQASQVRGPRPHGAGRRRSEACNPVVPRLLAGPQPGAPRRRLRQGRRGDGGGAARGPRAPRGRRRALGGGRRCANSEAGP